MSGNLYKVIENRNYVWDGADWVPFTQPSGGTGGTASADGAAFTPGVTDGTPAMGLYEAAPTSVADGKVGALGMTADRKLKVSGSFSSTPITASTPALSNVVDNAASVTVLAANANRLGFRIVNDSSAIVYLKCGAAASTTSFTEKLLPGQSWGTRELGVNYTGLIAGIWESAPGGAARVTELTA